LVFLVLDTFTPTNAGFAFWIEEDCFLIPNNSWREYHDDEQIVDWNDNTCENSEGLDSDQLTQTICKESNCSRTRGNSHCSHGSSERVSKSLFFCVHDPSVHLSALLVCIVEDENIISSNTKDNINNHNLQESEVFNLEDCVGDEGSEWET